MSNPTVTVLIPAYNAAHTIERAFRSVYLQDYAPLEIIVVDDGSTDDTSVVVGNYVDQGVRLITLERNSGECAAMNAGLQVAAGDYIAFLDADDEWLEGKLKKQIAFLDAHPKMSFVSCRWRNQSDGRRAQDLLAPDRLPTCPGGEVWRELLAAGLVAKPCVLARRSCITQVGGFDETCKVAGDQDMWIKLALAGEVGFLPDCLVSVHDTPGSLTKRYNLQQADYLLPIVKKHLEGQKQRLSAYEVRCILGRRYSTLGRNLYLAGSYISGIGYILRAVMLGYEPFQNLWYLMTASPPARKFKRRINPSHAA